MGGGGGQGAGGRKYRRWKYATATAVVLTQGTHSMEYMAMSSCIANTSIHTTNTYIHTVHTYATALENLFTALLCRLEMVIVHTAKSRTRMIYSKYIWRIYFQNSLSGFSPHTVTRFPVLHAPYSKTRIR
jgi:hypothetical protein